MPSVREDAIVRAERSVAVLRNLAATNPDEYGFRLASALVAQADALVSAGRREDAVVALDEAVAVSRPFLGRGPAVTELLALVLGLLASFDSESVPVDRRLAAATEALSLRRALAASGDTNALAQVACALASWGSALLEAGRATEAKAALEEASAIFLALPEDESAAAAPDLSSTLTRAVSRASGTPAALQVQEFLVAVLRVMVTTDEPGAVRNLAVVLINLSGDLAATGRHADAIAAARESVKLLRGLAASDHAEHLVELIYALVTLLGRSGNDEAEQSPGLGSEILAYAKEAVDLFESASPTQLAEMPDEVHQTLLEIRQGLARAEAKQDSPVTEAPSTLRSTPTPQRRLSRNAQRAAAGYAFEEPSIDIGCLVEDGAAVPGTEIRIPFSVMARHGVIASSLGAGRTRTIQVALEELSAAGVPVLVTDWGGDLSGLALPGEPTPERAARTEEMGRSWVSRAVPVEFYAPGETDIAVPMRVTPFSLGPDLLAEALALTASESSMLKAAFWHADSSGLALLDYRDLVALMTFLASDAAESTLRSIGGTLKDVEGVIRALLGPLAGPLQEFLGEPEFNAADLSRVTRGGEGVVSILDVSRWRTCSWPVFILLLWLLGQASLDSHAQRSSPGDLRLAIVIDEADDLLLSASEELFSRLVRVLDRLSAQGVAVVFAVESIDSIPPEFHEKFGWFLLHRVRANTPTTVEALGEILRFIDGTIDDAESVITGLPRGEAIVYAFLADGTRTPVVRCRVRTPESSIESMPEEWRAAGVPRSAMTARYGRPIDRPSAKEILARFQR